MFPTDITGMSKLPAFKNAELKKLVTQPYAQAVEPAQRKHPFVYLYKVAFHSFTEFIILFVVICSRRAGSCACGACFVYLMLSMNGTRACTAFCLFMLLMSMNGS